MLTYQPYRKMKSSMMQQINLLQNNKSVFRIVVAFVAPKTGPIHLVLVVVLRGQTLFSCRGIITCSIRAPHKKVWYGSQMLPVLDSSTGLGVLLDSDVNIAYVLLHFLLGKCTLLRTKQIMY